MGGVWRGLGLTLLLSGRVWIRGSRRRERARKSVGKIRLAERMRSLGRAGWILGIIVLTIGGIYAGVFSAVEAAGVGAFLALLVTIGRRKLSWENIVEVISSTLKSTGTVFLILFGAFVFKTFVDRKSVL